MKKLVAIIFLLSFLGNAGAQIVKKDTLHFDVNKLQVKEGTQKLNKIVKFALRDKDYQIYITAHTDSFGEASKNMQLAEKRANEVKKYLIKSGLKKERIIVKSYGESKPLIQTADKNLIAQNRRVEISCKIPIPL